MRIWYIYISLCLCINPTNNNYPSFITGYPTLALHLNSTSLDFLNFPAMANAPNVPYNLTHPTPHTIKVMASGIRYEERAGSSTTHEFIEKFTFPILRLPVELQIKVADQIGRYTDLKAFLLTCKELFDVATPSLYKCVDLRSTGYDRFDSGQDADEQLSRRIRSLLIKSANLRFIRVLKTSNFGLGSTQLMDGLLPLLRDDFLTEFNYSTKSVKQFPTPSQLQLLWGRQKNLQNLKIYSHIVPSLEEFFNKTERNRTAFAKLTISDNSELQSYYEFNMISWPLKHLDLCLLQYLTFNGRDNTKASNILSSLNPLFAAGSFASLVKLSFKRICFDETLDLTNMPSLDHLSVANCRAPLGQPLVNAHNIRLRSLMHMVSGPLEEICPLLTQINGVEDLVIVCPIRMNIAFHVQMDLICAITKHKETLRTLDLELYPILRANLTAPIWEVNVLLIQNCKNLVKLWLPLMPNRITSHYRNVISALPRLSCLTIYTYMDLSAKWSPNLATDLFPASSELSKIEFETYSHEPYRVIRRGS